VTAQTHSLTIQAHVSQLATVRQFIADTGASLGVPEAVTDPLILAVDESLSNVIVHGYAGRPGTIRVALEQAAGALVVRLRDQAPPFDPTRLPNPDTTLPLDQRPIGGMGVYLARRSVDQISYQPTDEGGNQLTLVKKFPAS
jgi:serine/threonine-protein kinase RsbW